MVGDFVDMVKLSVHACASACVCEFSEAGKANDSLLWTLSEQPHCHCNLC